MENARRRGVIVGGFLAFSYGWIVGTEPLVVPVAAATGWPVAAIEVTKGLLFVTLTAVLLWFALGWHQQRALLQERRWHDLADATNTGLFALAMGKAPRLLYANATFERTVGRSVGEFQTDPTLPFQIVAEQDAATLRSVWLSPRTQTWPVALQLQLPDGTERQVELSGSIVEDRKGRDLFQGMLADVTAQQQREQQLEAAAAAERAASDELARVAAVRQSLLTAMSHELRTPLTVVSGWAHTLLRHRGRLTRAQQLQAETAIWEQTERLTLLVDDLVQLGPDRSGREFLAPGPCAAGQLVAATVAASPVASRARVQVPDELEVVVDREQLRRVVTELLSNVAKYAPEGPVDVEVGSYAGSWQLRVSDSGPDLPDGVETEAFEVFSRYHLDHHSPGAGLGLPLVARFVAAHGGDVDLQSRPDGLTVTVTFPLELPAWRPHLKAV